MDLSITELAKIAPEVAVFIGILGAVAMFTIGLLAKMKRVTDSASTPEHDEARSIVIAINNLTYSVQRLVEIMEKASQPPSRARRRSSKSSRFRPTASCDSIAA